MSTTARASSVDTDMMEGEKIELDMRADKQVLEPPIKAHGSEGSDARGFRDSTTQQDSDIKCLNVFRSRRLVARKTMTNDTLRFGGSREGKTPTWFSRTSVGSGPTMCQVICCERRRKDGARGARELEAAYCGQSPCVFSPIPCQRDSCKLSHHASGSTWERSMNTQRASP